MKKFVDALGLSGTILVLLGVVIFAVRRTFNDPIVMWNVILGATFLVTWLWFNLRRLGEMLVSRKTQYGSLTILWGAAVLVLLGFANVIAARHPHRIDLTENKVYSLSDQTKKILDHLTDPVEVIGFYIEGTEGAVEDLLKAYSYASDKFHYRFVDPAKNPTVVKEYDLEELGEEPRTLLVVSGEQKVKVDEESEEAITKAILKVASGESKTVCFSTGHGEADIESDARFEYSAMKKALLGENYKVESIVLAEVGEVPDRCTALVIARVQKPLLEEEWATVDRYLEDGGHVLLMADPMIETGMTEFAKKWGVEIGNDLVIDKTQRLFFVQLGDAPIIGSFGDHPIVKGWDAKRRVVLPTTRSVRKMASPPEGLTVTELLLSSKEGWAETNLDLLRSEKPRASLDDADLPGPVAMGVAVSKKVSKQADETPAEARLVVLGDADFVNNTNIVQFYNEDFFLNAINWLTGQEASISIRPRRMRSSTIQLTEREHYYIFYGSVLFLPEVVAIIGILIWIMRRD